MQIVIEIDENMYQKIKGMENLVLKNRTFKSLELAVLEGKVLPEHHGDLIDRNDLSLMTVHMIDGVFVCDVPTIIEATKTEVKE